MKRIVLKIMILLLTVQGALGQFKAFVGAVGFAHSRGAMISHIAIAGGGVVLKGVARPKYADSAALFTRVSFNEGPKLSTIYIQTNESNLHYSDSSWLMRDAAMLVKSEKTNEMYRDVNLFGEFNTADYKKGLHAKYPPQKYFNVEMTDSLRRTESGQTLLYMDIILTSPANTRYYSNDRQAYDKYEASADSLSNILKPYNDSIQSEREKINLSLDRLDSLKGSRALDSVEVEKYSEEMDSLSKLNYKSWNDYTYNDENSDYTFYYTKNDGRLHIDGVPNYTFLYHLPYLDSIEVNTTYTAYYTQNFNIIKNLNYVVVTNAEHLAKIAAFYRYLKANYPLLWNRVYTHYAHTRKKSGRTPRFIYILKDDY
jgi:hypothetical protein